LSRFRIAVDLPTPRKPVMTLVGMAFSADM
jgi:hypothetical protein